MSVHADRLTALRHELARRGLHGFVVPLTDEHMSEYIGGYAQRLTWLTGYDGSAGTAVVLEGEAAIFVDGRYTLQVREQVSADDWSYQPVPEVTVAAWLKEHAPDDCRIGYDAWLHGKSWVETTRTALEGRGRDLVAVADNPIDALWDDQPGPSAEPAIVHSDELAGQSSSAKLKAIAEWLSDEQLDTVVLTMLDSIAWTFNIRGSDVSRTPVVLAYALVHADASADLFVEPDKIGDNVAAHLGEAVRLHPRSAFTDALAALKGRRIAADPDRAVAAIFERLEQAGASIYEARDPVVLAKAIKNAVEIDGAIAAHVRDGFAVARFLHWIDTVAAEGLPDELTAAARLEAFRRDTGMLRDLAFDTIAGAGPNGAIVHYRATSTTTRRIEPGTLLLVDSGGQYPDGTTDITRTIAIGEPTAEMRDRFTRVLKGHIALARAVFPRGTRGHQLDTMARQFLWEAGLDFVHGTGHGVGSYLAVHEGPQRINYLSSHSKIDEPLHAGMIVSNEPGYYKAGAYGIRIENLMLVEPRELPGADKRLLGFRTLTLAPIDRRLVDPSMLTATERGWLNDYHGRVRAEIGALLPDAIQRWFEAATAPI